MTREPSAAVVYRAGTVEDQMNACLGCGKDTELYFRGDPMCPEVRLRTSHSLRYTTPSAHAVPFRPR